jgi:TrpR-related protein YerC/YecD
MSKNIKPNLITAVLALKTPNEAQRFLRDLLTENELKEFENRWRAAQLLDNNVSYSTIIKQTGLSSTTVARIAKWLNDGKGGYRLVLKRLGSHHHTNHISRRE